MAQNAQKLRYGLTRRARICTFWHAQAKPLQLPTQRGQIRDLFGVAVEPHQHAPSGWRQVEG